MGSAIRSARMGAVLAVIWVGVTSGFASPTYDDAVALYQKRQFSEARTAFQQYVAANPTASNAKPAQFYAIKCLFETRAYAQMDQEIEALRASDPTHPALDDLTFLQGYALQLQLQWDAARKRFEEFIQLYPDSSYVSRARQSITACQGLTEPALPPEGTSPEDGAASRTAYVVWLVRLVDAGYFAPVVDRAEAFLALYPNAPESPDAMFQETRSLRGLKQWAESRAKANEIVQRFPASECAGKMGGGEGRTEDQAAIDFADIVKDYGAHRFADCIGKIETFLQAYPNNWRLTEICRYYCYALYHGKDPRFFDLSNELLKTTIDPRQTDQIEFLQAAMLTRQKQFAEARQLLDSLQTRFPNSKLSANMVDLRLETYFLQQDYSTLLRLAAEESASHPAGNRARVYATFWLGFGKCRLSPPDLDGAAQAFQSLLSANIQDPDLLNPKNHFPLKAACWLGWIAQQRGDMTAAQSYIDLIRQQMPEGPEKNEALSRLQGGMK